MSKRQPLKTSRGDRRGPGPPGETNWIWGAHAALAALANPARRIERFLATRNAAARLPPGLAPDIVEPDALDHLLPAGAVHQGLAVRAAPLPDLTLAEACAPADGRPVLVLDQVTDPQNVGAIFRSAAAFGARAVILQDRNSPPLTGALAKAAAGAIETVAQARVVNIARAVEELTELGYRTIGLTGSGEMTIAEAVRGEAQVALVLGAEGKGMRDLVAQRCDVRARIPIRAAMQSLNVSAAAAIALYAAAARPTG